MRSPLERFWAKVDTSGECWLWTGCVSTNGYGRFNAGSNRIVNAHRWIMGEVRGAPVPADRDVDHLCRVRHCVRPDHLEVVTHAENMRRSPYAIRRREREFCDRGHNDWIPKVVNRTTYRMCRACNLAGGRAA